MRILIAEDESELNKALVTIFEKNNYSVDGVYNGEDALAFGSTNNYDGIILDIMMPVLDGMEVLSRLRKKQIFTPVLLLTAKSEVTDKVAGLDAGADDYLPKPFAVSELLARVRAMLRRKNQFSPDDLNFCGMILSKISYEIIYNGKIVRLISKEFQMMEMMMEQPEQIITTGKFLEHIWGWDTNADISIVWVYISNLRKKLFSVSAPAEIKAVKGVGYILEKKNG